MTHLYGNKISNEVDIPGGIDIREQQVFEPNPDIKWKVQNMLANDIKMLFREDQHPKNMKAMKNNNGFTRKRKNQIVPVCKIDHNLP